jgi:Phosphoribosyl transferase/TRSP domain C terminus to PRTase_2
MTLSPPSSASPLFELARRRNPKRSGLFVSTVLGKHMPADPRTVLASGRLLAVRIASAVGPPVSPDSAAITDLFDSDLATSIGRKPLPAIEGGVVVGFCETAVGLGATVAVTLGLPYVHSTRYPRNDQYRLLSFTESHSHAPSHELTHFDPDVLLGGTAILVDDELTTGATALSLIAEIHAQWPRDQYIVATLLDWRSNDSVVAFERAERRLGATITLVSLLRGNVEDHAVPEPNPYEGTNTLLGPTVEVMAFSDIREATPWSLSDGGNSAVRDAMFIAEALRKCSIARVLGVEECMYLPTLVAEKLRATIQSTTLSPVVVSRDIGYPVRSAVSFKSPFGLVDSWAYNVGVGQPVALISDGGDPRLNVAMAEAISRHTGAPVHLVLTAQAADRWNNDAKVRET